MTQEALAHAAGVTVGHFSMIERGHSNPTWATVRAVALAADTLIRDLAQLTEKMKNDDEASQRIRVQRRSA